MQCIITTIVLSNHLTQHSLCLSVAAVSRHIPSCAVPSADFTFDFALVLQGYDACTWESEQSASLMQPEHIQLLLQLWERQRRSMARSSEEARRAERAAQQQAERQSLPVGSTLNLNPNPEQHT